MNNTVAKIFTGKLYFLTELLVSGSMYSMVTLIFYYYTKDESFFNAFYYIGVFFTIQIIWQLFQERQEMRHEEDEHYPLKISVFLFLTFFFSAAFLGVYFIFFHNVMSLHFNPIGPLDLLKVQEVDSKPDVYIRVKAFYDDYYSLSFSMNMFTTDENSNPQFITNTVGCGCGVEFGPLLGTIASPVSSIKFTKKKFDDVVLFPTMSCFCKDEDDCTQTLDNTNKNLYYRINGDYEKAIRNTECPPKTMDFIQIFDRPNVNPSNVQIILLFVLGYIPMTFNFVNFLMNYTKLGFMAFIKGHENVRVKGVSAMIIYFFLKWSMLVLACFFIVEEIIKEYTNEVLYIIAGLGALPGVIFGVFFYIFNPNFKFELEFKNVIAELKEYAGTTHESVENFLDLCFVALQLLFKYFSKAVREFLVSLGFKGLAQSIFLFAFVAPEFISEFIDEAAFQQLPTNIRNNLIINSMILITGVCHGLLIGAAIIIYQLVFDRLRVLGIIAAVWCFVFFVFSVQWFVQQLIYFKSFKKALAGHILWLYPTYEIRLNRSLVNLYFNAGQDEAQN